MYSILLSKIEGLELLRDRYLNILNENSKVVILPWAFATELNSDKLLNEYFKKNGERYNKYIKQLKSFGVNESNIQICDCYGQSNRELVKVIENSDVILLPGGNPEMLMSKILHKTELFYTLKRYKGIIIGESAGALLQLERYFITAKNNFYKYLAFYDGIGVLSNPFLIDVHSDDTEEYIEELQNIAQKTAKDIYAIYDNGAILYNRVDRKVECFGKTRYIKKMKI